MCDKEDDIKPDLKNSLWSVRMRASKTAKSKEQRAESSKANHNEIHISGAEGLYKYSEIDRIAREYFLRAMNHPKDKPDKVVITVEEVKGKPVMIPLLQVSTDQCNSPDEARSLIRKLLSDSGISEKAIRNGLKVVTGKRVMHGASLILNRSALRAEPDRKRGVRVTRMGIERAAEERLERRLAKEGINTTTVREALILASKVASCEGVIAELCISDDPHYTTGYVASKGLGYLRIANIKRKGNSAGGRVFFIKENSDVKRISEYLERTPVIVGI